MNSRCGGSFETAWLRGQLRDRLADLRADGVHHLHQFLVAHRVRDRVVMLGLHPLAQHHVHPGIDGEQLASVHIGVPGFLE
jgi:hypothetical protein